MALPVEVRRDLYIGGLEALESLAALQISHVLVRPGTLSCQGSNTTAASLLRADRYLCWTLCRASSMRHQKCKQQ